MFETYAYFFVCDFEENPSEITDKLEIQPTKTWMKGDIGLTNKLREFNNWEVHSPLERSEIFLNKHIEAVLDIIEPKQVLILKFRENGWHIGINCVGYYSDEHPGFHLSSNIISRLAKLSLDVDFDLYCLSKEAK